VRVLVLTGAGRSFSAGADLNWMRRTASYGEAENLADARALARLMQTLNELPKPTVARVNGPALGGGTGLVACCDVVIASEQAVFGTTEVRLGLIPSVIGPYVLAAIGPRHARRLMLTGERISAAEALRLGLVHDVVASEQLDLTVERMVGELLKSGPDAIAAAKRLIRDLSGRPIEPALIDETAQRIAALRATPEAREGIGAFLEKRAPGWLS
jgi:methylglutaconyl-CoA hydratase